VEISPANLAYTVPLAIEPAGGMTLTPHDYGRFLQLHLRGLTGRDDVLKAATIQGLHKRGSAMGWSVMPRDGVESHEHSGSYAADVAFTTLQPERDLAIGVFTNVGGGQDLKDAVARLAFQIAARLSQEAASRYDPSITESRAEEPWTITASSRCLLRACIPTTSRR
jgi:CubicO group peptidase (beta-lactamase class C family)